MSVRRQWVSAVVAALAITLVATLMVLVSRGSLGSLGNPLDLGEATKTAVTTKDGGTAQLSDGTTVRIPPGAVDSDAVLRLSRGRGVPTIPSGTRSAGPPVLIALSGGRLVGTATVRLPVRDIAADANWPAGAPREYWAAYYDDATQSWVAEDGRYRDGFVTVEVDHFSWWNPFVWDYQAIGDSVRQALADLVGAPSGVPVTCASAPPSGGADEVKIVIEGAYLLNWCLDRTAEGTVLRVRGTQDFPLLVSWTGTASLLRRSEYQADLASAYRWLAAEFNLHSTDAVALPAGGSADIVIAPDTNAPVFVTATWESRLQLMGIVDATARVVMAVRGALGVATTTEQVVQRVLDAQCLGQHTDNLADDPAGTSVTILTACVDEIIRDLTRHAGRGVLRFVGAVPGVAGALLSVVGYTANQAIVSLGTAGNAFLADETDARLTFYVGDQPSAPRTGGEAASPWPTRDNEGPPRFFAWLGAGLYDFPDFTSCTHDGRWCIGGFGDVVRIFELRPLREVGSVPTSAIDPTVALTAKGLPAATATELLRAG